MAPQPPRLDDTDHKIIALLREDGRRTYADLGTQVALSTAAAKRRVNRLERLGVITGYAARINPQALGPVVDALVEVYCADRTAPRDVKGVVEGIPEVVTALTVAGDADAVVILRVSDVAHLERAVERLRRDENVVRTRTMLVLSTLVDRS